MCCCPKPNVNGEPGAYSWDGKTFMTATPFLPALADGDVSLFDEPGRCGHGMGDSHSHELRFVKAAIGGYALLVRHGGGEERIPLGHSNLFATMLESMDSNARYGFLIRFYHIQRDLTDAATQKANALWRQAAADKRIKTRKLRTRDSDTGRARVKVWIEPAQASG